MKTLVLIFSMVIIFNRVFNSQGLGRIVVKQLQDCDDNVDYDFSYNFTFKTINNKQYVDGIWKFKIPLDNTLRSNISLYTLNGKNYVYLFSTNDRKACETLHKYMGEFLYDIERYSGLIPGTCPIPTGRRLVHNYLIDLKKIRTIESLPFGTLRFTGRWFDKNNKVVSCVIAEGENNLY